ALMCAMAMTGLACAQSSGRAQPQAVAAPQPAAEGFTVRVKFNNPKNHKTLIAYSKGEEHVMDMNPATEDGYQVFRGSVDGVVLASFVVRSPDNVIQSGGGFIPGPGLSFVLRNGADVTIEGDAAKPYMAT